jgi:Zn-dependent peptidase ImmA (M78 family)
LVEAQGVFVYQINASTTDDWRGIAIFDERNIPVIVINSNETFPAAKSFTLFHEYAHLLLRQGVVGASLHTFREADFRRRIFDASWPSNAPIFDDGRCEKA